MLIQVLPLKALAHPIWTSAETALGRPVTATISIEPAASVIALGQYLSMIALALVSAAVAADRQRAETILFAITGAGAAIAVILLVHDVLFSGIGLLPFMKAQAIDSSGMGVIVASAACVRTIERYETRSSNPQRSASRLLLTFVACSGALALCASALILSATRGAIFASGCGIVALACVVIIRRSGFGALGAMAIAVPAIGVAFLLVITQSTPYGGNLLLAFASSPTVASGRVLEDAPLAGAGAGTFAALARIYREMNDPPSESVASTAAATFAIELGRPMLWLIVAATGVSILVLLRASLHRGRDSFYPAMGGSCLLALLLLAFINDGLFGGATSLIVAAVLGLAIAQSKSRTLQP
jgi:hypothetical protein